MTARAERPSEARTATGDTPDRLLGGRIALWQPRHGYRAAIDPVLLAAAVPAAAGERILDLGAGVGAAALCLAARVAGAAVVGLEVQPALAALAARNIRLNGVGDHAAILVGDVRAPPLAPGSFDRVLCNPPYLAAGRHTAPPDPGKAAANLEIAGDFGDFVAAAAALVRRRGSLTLIHRADRLAEILASLDGRFGGLVVFPLWPRRGSAARRILVHGRRGIGGPLRLAAGLVLHGEDGRFTAAAETVLRDGGSLEL
ncbi:MAG: methyltransferase [Azospirillum sp.]|nr:methyltransferase [Azospirillum sp.]